MLLLITSVSVSEENRTYVWKLKFWSLTALTNSNLACFHIALGVMASSLLNGKSFWIHSLCFYFSSGFDT